MTTTFALDREQMVLMQRLVRAAVENVARGLTELVAAEVTVSNLQIRTVPLMAVGRLLGDPEIEVAAVYLVADGEIPASLLLLMQVPTAHELCDILLEQAGGTTCDLGAMEYSVLGEVGNVVGSLFLNSIADNVGLTLHIPPPGVLCDMVAAVIDLTLVDVAMHANEALVIDADFLQRGRHLPIWFLVFPEPARLRRVLDRRAEQKQEPA